MLARSSRYLLSPASMPRGLVPSMPKVGPPSIALQARAPRGFASCTTVRNSAESETFLPYDDTKDGDSKLSPLHRLEYILNEPQEPSQHTLIEQLSDEQLHRLPIVVNSRSRWKPVDARFTLPRKDRSLSRDDDFSAYRCADYVYNTFSFPSLQHLKRFHKEAAEHLDSRAKVVNNVLLFDSRSRTLTIGLPAYIGLEPPRPAKINVEMIQRLLAEYRAEETPAEQKREVANQLRSHVIGHGFKKSCSSLSTFLFALYEKVRRASIQEVIGSSRNFAAEAYTPNNSRRIEEHVPVDVGLKVTDDVARKATSTWKKERVAGAKGERKPRAASPKKREPNLADRLRADDPRLPEAGTFVAPDGGAHKAGNGADAVEEHVPFPKPTAEEMGIKPANVTDELKADDPKLPEAGTFVAQDGDAHKPSKGVDALQEHVPFPKPTAEEMGIKKPTET